MLTKTEIDQKYIAQASQLEAEFFDIVEEFVADKKVGQHRVLKADKSIAEFNQRHGEIWRNHEAELIAEGFLKPPIPPEPVRDLAAEIDDLKAKVEKLEKK